MSIFKSIILLFAFSSVFSFAQMPAWTTSIEGGALISSFDSSGTESGVGFYAGLQQKFYFTDQVGMFSGLIFAQRKLNFQDDLFPSGGSSGAAKYLDIPLGLSFQHSAWGSGVGQVDIGVAYSVPLSDYAISTYTYDSQSYLNLLLSFTTAFPVDDDFYLGFNLTYKYGLADGVVASDGSASRSNDFQFGLVGQLRYD